MAKKKKKNKKVKIIWVILGISILLLLVFFIVSGIIIGKSVREQCDFAKEKYGDNCVNSLMLLLNDTSNSFRERNSAIWALGQLGDKKALTVLEKYYTGQIPQKKSLSSGISQYELKKSINLLESGINITGIVWKHKGIIKQ